MVKKPSSDGVPQRRAKKESSPQNKMQIGLATSPLCFPHSSYNHKVPLHINDTPTISISNSDFPFSSQLLCDRYSACKERPIILAWDQMPGPGFPSQENHHVLAHPLIFDQVIICQLNDLLGLYRGRYSYCRHHPRLQWWPTPRHVCSAYDPVHPLAVVRHRG